MNKQEEEQPYQFAAAQQRIRDARSPSHLGSTLVKTAQANTTVDPTATKSQKQAFFHDGIMQPRA